MGDNPVKCHVAITARKGRGKHEQVVGSCPVVVYPIQAADECLADTKTIWTDCPVVKSYTQETSVEVCDRPEHTTTDTSPHRDIIRHIVETQMTGPEDLFVILLGNSPAVDAALINRCFTHLLKHTKHDSLMTVWKAGDDHPYRALQVGPEGFVKPFGGHEVHPTATSNRQSYPDVYFYDQGIWAFRARCALDEKGPFPWVWLGEKCGLIVRPWVTGRDMHDSLDYEVATALTKTNKHVPEIISWPS